MEQRWNWSRRVLMPKARNFLAHKVVQIALQILLCVLVEVFAEQIHNALELLMRFLSFHHYLYNAVSMIFEFLLRIPLISIILSSMRRQLLDVGRFVLAPSMAMLGNALRPLGTLLSHLAGLSWWMVRDALSPIGSLLYRIAFSFWSLALSPLVESLAVVAKPMWTIAHTLISRGLSWVFGLARRIPLMDLLRRFSLSSWVKRSSQAFISGLASISKWLFPRPMLEWLKEKLVPVFGVEHLTLQNISAVVLVASLLAIEVSVVVCGYASKALVCTLAWATMGKQHAAVVAHHEQHAAAWMDWRSITHAALDVLDLFNGERTTVRECSTWTPDLVHHQLGALVFANAALLIAASYVGHVLLTRATSNYWGIVETSTTTTETHQTDKAAP